VRTLIVTDHGQEWFDIPDTPVLTARQYLGEADGGGNGNARVLNLCRTGRYQGRGYYVSLLAEARGQRPLPDAKSIEDLKSQALVQGVRTQLQSLVEETLKHDESDLFQLDAYLGQDPARRHQALAEKLFASARAPLLRVVFKRVEGHWCLDDLQAIGLADVPTQDRAFLVDTIKAHVRESDTRKSQGTGSGKPRLAILCDPSEKHKCSNDEALRRLVEIAPMVGLEAELIGPGDLERLEEFDALFNRASPEVQGFPYEFARRAESLGMPVVDDSKSILRCLNKVYMHELMNRHGVPTPRTLTVHRSNVDKVIPTMGLPCVLKLPDSGFGLDVVKIESEEDLRKTAERFFRVSELFVAQEWLPTGFDWRVGVYDRRPLFVAKYFMAPGHWKIIRVDDQEVTEGETQAMAIGEAPEHVIELAVRAANLVGRGLYGVDLKQVEGRVYLIEVNCNPNIDAGNEDQVLGDALYREILGVFARRIAEARSGTPR
jgi:glutathione synthase/RimK-type ligase-like ATP-grasp enzyme